MSIISSAMLEIELPSGTDSTKLANAVLRGSFLTDAWSIHYEKWPDYVGSGTNAPYEIVYHCTEICKALYMLSIGQTFRDGNENETWQGYLDKLKKSLATIDIEPEENIATISLDSNGVQMLGSRGDHILRYHPLCRVVSGSSNIWNQGYHWDIRKGCDTTDEYRDAWYFDAATYDEQIEGTIYYYKSWRNDALDYQKFSPVNN